MQPADGEFPGPLTHPPGIWYKSAVVTPHRPQPSMTFPWRTVAIVGVGLIGGSIGRALRDRGLARRVIGVGRSPASLAEARRLGAITEESVATTSVAEADLVVLATGVAALPGLLDEIDAAVRPGTLITDAGSTKASLVGGWERRRRSRRGRFVGAHPLAGSHRRGPAAADADLFAGRVTVVTPAAATPARDVEEAATFWSALGSTVFVMPPREHDRILAELRVHELERDARPSVEGHRLEDARHPATTEQRAEPVGAGDDAPDVGVAQRRLRSARRASRAHRRTRRKVGHRSAG